MNITDNPYDDYGRENYGIWGMLLGTSMGNQWQKYKILRKSVHLSDFVELSSLIILVKKL